MSNGDLLVWVLILRFDSFDITMSWLKEQVVITLEFTSPEIYKVEKSEEVYALVIYGANRKRELPDLEGTSSLAWHFWSSWDLLSNYNPPIRNWNRRLRYWNHSITWLLPDSNLKNFAI